MFLLSRRRIGALIVFGGLGMVGLGFTMPLTSEFPVSPGTLIPKITTPVIPIQIPNRGSIALLTADSRSAFDSLLHTFDHPPLNSGALGSMVVDVAMRAGIVLIVIGAGFGLALNVLPLMRGMVGVAAGIGLMGTAIEAGVILGERSRTLGLCAGTSCQVDLHAGIWLIGIGFAVVLVGGAIGAMRPLAGLVAGVSFAGFGGVLGAGIVYLVSQQHVLDLGSQIMQVLPHV